MTAARDAVEDFIGRLRPHERLGVAIGEVDVPTDGCLQLARAAMDAAAQLLLRQRREPACTGSGTSAGQVVTDGEVALFALLWVDPALPARRQAIAIALLLLPVPIFLVAVGLIGYISLIAEAPPLRRGTGWVLYALASAAALSALLALAHPGRLADVPAGGEPAALKQLFRRWREVFSLADGGSDGAAGPKSSWCVPGALGGRHGESSG